MKRIILTAVAVVASLVAVLSAVPQPEAGASIDPGSFQFRRGIPDGRPGAVALILDAAALAHSRGPDEHFADVRILDGSNRQVPYVVEHRDEPMALTLVVDRADPPVAARTSVAKSNWSTYRLALPSANLPPSQIAIDTSARVFQRGVQISILRPADRHSRTAWLDVISATVWAHVAADDPAAPLVLPVAPRDASELWLSIDEGDNSRLPITAVRLLLPSYRLRFYRPARSSLQLVYGRSDLLAPRYDLALLSSEVVGAEAVAVTPRAESRSGAIHRPLISPLAFWLFLSLAVVVLLAVIVRLASRGS